MTKIDSDWEADLERQERRKERRNRFLKKLALYGLYGGSALLILGLGGLGGYFSRDREVTRARQEISQLESKLEEQKTANEAAINYAASLSDSLYLWNVAIDSLKFANRNLRVGIGEQTTYIATLIGEQTVYMNKADSMVTENSVLTMLLDGAIDNWQALQDSVGTLNDQIKVYDLKLQESQDEIIRLRSIQEASKPQVIKLPGDISTRFIYYIKNGDNAGGLTISKSLGQSNIIDTAFEGGFNFFESRDTGQFLGFRLSLDLLERFSWDFGLGPYILRDFSDGAKATLTLYGESGFYFEPFGKVKGLGLRVSIRNIEDRVDYSAALELGRR